MHLILSVVPRHIHQRLFWLCLLLLASCASIPPYNRADYNFRSYQPDTNIGYYSGQACEDIEIDHIVSLREAHEAGAWRWPKEKKREFANDRSNHVAACASINRSKGASGPQEFFRKSSDGEGFEFSFVDFCGYVARYVAVKKAYQLSFEGNDEELPESCQ
jgi:hypothetical protein